MRRAAAPNLSQADAVGCPWICIDPDCPELCAGELETEDLVEGGGAAAPPPAGSHEGLRLFLREWPPSDPVDLPLDLKQKAADILGFIHHRKWTTEGGEVNDRS